jgi:predicted GNAT family acetyltransferase
MLTKGTKDDRSRILQYCMSEPSINTFIIGDIEIHGFETDFQDVWIQTQEGRITGIVLRYYDNFIIYSHKLDMAYAEVVDLLKSAHANIISGKSSVMEPLAVLLGNAFTKKELFFCELQGPSKLSFSMTEVKIATRSEAREISFAYGEIPEFAGLYSSDPELRFQQIANRIESGEGTHMIIREDGRIISHGNTTAETTVSAMIGGIFTLPEFRNAGLASKIISALCTRLLDQKKSVCLFYDNEDAGRIYQRLNFKVIENWTILGRI